MDIKKSFIVDDEGKPKAVVIDYDLFKRIEGILLDYGLGKAMDEVAEEEEVDLEEAKRITGFIQQETS